MRARQALLYALTARSTITQTTSACYMCTVGQNQCLHGIYSWQISMYVYGSIQCICTILANPIHGLQVKSSARDVINSRKNTHSCRGVVRRKNDEACMP